MQLRALLLLALAGCALASKGHHVHHLSDADFSEKTADGKVGAVRHPATASLALQPNLARAR